MPTALPPELDGPITPASKQVYVDNVLPQSLVTVYADGKKAGQTTSTTAGAIWVPLTVTLVAKTPPQEITATQNYQGKDPAYEVTMGESEPSNSVPVQPVPDPLPPPVFASGLSTCMDAVCMSGLVPGVNLTIVVGKSTPVNTIVSQPTQWFNLAVVPIPAGSILIAQQTYAPKNESPMTPSLPVAAAPKSLDAPAISTPLRPCQTTIDLANMCPGADVRYSNGTANGTGVSPWPSYSADVPPLQPGKVTVQQYFTRCQEITGPPASVPVAPAPLPMPAISYAACGDVKQLTVLNLLPGEVLIVSRAVETSPGIYSTEVIGSQGVSGTSATVRLPASFQSTDPRGPVFIKIDIVLCGQTLPPPGSVMVPFATAGGPYPAPAVPGPLYACGRSVYVTGAHPGSTIQIFSGTTSDPRSNAVVAASPDLTIGLWSPLTAKEVIFAQQTGCKANGPSNHFTVLGFSSLPTPTIAVPVRPGATSIVVTNVYPGAQVYLSVNGSLRTEMEATATTITIPTGAPLTNQEMLQVIQTLCTLKSEPGTATVTIGVLGLVQSGPQLVRGETAVIAIDAVDQATSKPVNGLPVTVSVGFKGTTPTGPSVSSVTGAAFKYTPGAKDPTAEGLVIGGPGYANAILYMGLVDPLKVWSGSVTPNSAIVYGSGFDSTTCEVVVQGEGLIPTKTFVGDISTGIHVSISCTGTPGQYWNITVQAVSGGKGFGPMVNSTIGCPS